MALRVKDVLTCEVLKYLLYEEKLSLKAIGQLFGVTKQYVSRLVKDCNLSPTRPTGKRRRVDLVLLRLQHKYPRVYAYLQLLK